MRKSYSKQVFPYLNMVHSEKWLALGKQNVPLGFSVKENFFFLVFWIYEPNVLLDEVWSWEFVVETF